MATGKELAVIWDDHRDNHHECDLAGSCVVGPFSRTIDDLHDTNTKLLEALEVAIEWRDKLFANPESQEAWEALVEEDGCLDNEARKVIEEVRRGD